MPWLRKIAMVKMPAWSREDAIGKKIAMVNKDAMVRKDGQEKCP
jgi:hypothetical protein